MLTLLLALGAWGLLESLRASRPTRPEREGKGHPLALADAQRGRVRARVQHQDARGVHPAARARRSCTWSRRRDLAAPRIGRLLAAGGVLAVIALSWMTIVDLIPKADRPYVGSSANDTVWNLAVGYNGFGRITGSAGASAAP